MEHIESLRAQEEKGHEPRRFSAVFDTYRNPGLPSNARWISEDFEQKVIPGAEGLLGLC